MYQDNVVLCACSAYERKFFISERFGSLPQSIKDELKIMSVLFTEDVGGVLTLEFNEEGSLQLIATADETDLLYDEIGSVLKIKQIRNEKQELFESLEMYYRVVFLGEEFTDVTGN